MSAEADLMRNQRRVALRPGGGHDKLVRTLALVLPALIGALAAVMILAPLSPRGEISFLLDRNKADVAPNRLSVDSAMYRGRDGKGRPFSLTAGNAVQRTQEDQTVAMQDLVARMLLPDGPATLTAQSGRYRLDEELVNVDGIVRFTAADGYRLMARNVNIDLANNSVTGSGRIEGAIPAGTFSADSMQADLPERRIRLSGNVKMRMEPGKLRMP
ncbi:LPS export ABC transporter periplasmic protein LptC [Altererythrobacter sp. CAU 1778]